MKVYKNVVELIGHTPIVELQGLGKEFAVEANILGKVEYFNPGGSIKDRIAYAMIIDAEEKGLLKMGSTIIEPTSGNTGIGLAMVGVARGYRVMLTMPSSMSLERRQILKAYGAEIVLTDAALGMQGAIDKACELAKEISHSFIPSQFTNIANARIHYLTTGAEIYEDLNGKIDILVSGVGTGGTISGVGKYLKEKNKNIKIVAVEPKGSPVLSQGKKGPHKIQGIGAGFIPEVLDQDIYDEIITVSDEDSYAFTRAVAKTDGLLVGISSGAALFAAIRLGKRKENKDKNIVVILPDTGLRYLSTGVFD